MVHVKEEISKTKVLAQTLAAFSHYRAQTGRPSNQSRGVQIELHYARNKNVFIFTVDI